MTGHPRERRRAPRARADFPIYLTADNEPAMLKDISEIGLCCACRHQIDEMTMLGIDLQVPGRKQRHHLKGAVVRCEPTDGKQGEFEIAVYFTEVPAAAQADLRAYVTSAPMV